MDYFHNKSSVRLDHKYGISAIVTASGAASAPIRQILPNEKDELRTWYNGIHKMSAVSKDDVETFNRAKETIWQATRPILGPMMKDVLSHASDALQVCPVPALAPAASIILSIWTSIDNVKNNKVRLVKLAAKLASTLGYVHQKVTDGGPGVIEALKNSIFELTETFRDIHRKIIRMANLGPASHYWQRDSVNAAIAECSAEIDEALKRFQIDLEIIILKVVKRNSRRSPKDSYSYDHRRSRSPSPIPSGLTSRSSTSQMRGMTYPVPSTSPQMRMPTPQAYSYTLPYPSASGSNMPLPSAYEHGPETRYPSPVYYL